MLFIRTDGNSEIGTGHLMRCLSVAEAVRVLGNEVSFVVADSQSETILSGRGFNVICFDSVWNDLDAELDAFASVIELHSVRTVLIDSYFVTQQYLQRLCELAYIVYIDDLNAFHYPCDMLINYNCYAAKFDYPSRFADTRLLLGPEFAPLRDEFQNLPRRVQKKEVSSVLITAGGVDHFNVAVKLVKLAKRTPELESLEFHVVAGRLNQHLDDLKRLETDNSGVFIHCDVQRISQLMLDCDIAVSAGGSTLYELCACGTPTVTFALADNQIHGVEGFGNGFMLGVGDFREDEDSCLDRIISGLLQLVNDYELRGQLSEKGQGLVDGKGAARIAEALLA